MTPTSSPTSADRGAGSHGLRRLIPPGLFGLAGLACAACCVLPGLLAAGVVSGAAWAALGAWMPGLAVALAAVAGAARWWAQRRHRAGCAGDGGCGCP